MFSLHELLSPGELALFCNALASEPAHCATVAPDLLRRAVELRQAPEPLSWRRPQRTCVVGMVGRFPIVKFSYFVDGPVPLSLVASFLRQRIVYPNLQSAQESFHGMRFWALAGDDCARSANDRSRIGEGNGFRNIESLPSRRQVSGKPRAGGTEKMGRLSSWTVL